MIKLLDFIRKYTFLRILFFKAFKIFSFFNKFYLQKIRLKPKSVNLFADEMMPIGTVRQAILKGLGIPVSELRKKPLIAVANSYGEINPGHKHLRQLSEAVKAGILSAGGLPFEFNVPAPCDGLANGNEGMRYILPQRDLIANIIEMYIRSQWFDGMVTISSCDKINPGMLMAAARLDIPVICLPGGPNMQKIRFVPDKKSIDHKDYETLQDKLFTATSFTCGSCELMTTANTIQLLTEALGMALPYSSAVPAFSSEKLEFAYRTGERIISLIKEDLTPKKILTKESLENAIMVALAIGGSTNTALHIPAMAKQLGIEIKLNVFNQFNTIIPTLCAIAPNGPYGVVDLYIAGGIPAVMKRLRDNLHLNCLNVSGENVLEIIQLANILDENIIRPKENPYHQEGGIVALFGNLAPEGSIVKQSAVQEKMLKFRGKAKVFESEQEALQGLISGKVNNGEVIIIRNEGPKGGPGMPEMLSATTLIDLLNLEVALITDGRFSGASAGPCVGHITPEAYLGGNIALIKNGDIIEIDIPERKIEIRVSEEELKKRAAEWKREEKNITGYLKMYQNLVSSAAEGAILRY